MPRGPFSTRIEIPPFGPNFIKFSKTVSYEVNLAAQSSPSEVLLKFMFSKKATKIDKIFIDDLTLFNKCQIIDEDFVNFCGILRQRELY